MSDLCLACGCSATECWRSCISPGESPVGTNQQKHKFSPNPLERALAKGVEDLFQALRSASQKAPKAVACDATADAPMVPANAQPPASDVAADPLDEDQEWDLNDPQDVMDVIDHKFPFKDAKKVKTSLGWACDDGYAGTPAVF
ncbi:hypothetical protein AK812_SmicGene8877 [Symbiodinium microadriaticum]|uniref:Uncharacterized protein n=1 Tax=Symbiodinium microadriaticum TaxID=2951 RepID=A0A1Q9EJW1_SYMMI|nr:hypothetical protein AK812_SmicGene8877 [Symbiodinium microadriaticum]